jgi:hypothetical protein
MSFFRHREIFRSDVIRSVRRCESFEQIARQHSNWKTFALRTRYKRSAGPPDTLTVLPENAAMGRHIIFSHLLGERPIRRSLAHRLDEFPVGYSSASYTPAALASASPTGSHFAIQARCRPRTFQPTANSVLTFCAMPGDNRRDYSKSSTADHAVLDITPERTQARQAVKRSSFSDVSLLPAGRPPWCSHWFHEERLSERVYSAGNAWVMPESRGSASVASLHTRYGKDS